MRRGAIAVSIVAVLSLAGCGSSSGGGVYSCNSPADSTCADLAASTGSTFSASDVTALQVACNAAPGTWSSTTACTATGRVGTCTFTTPAATTGLSVSLATQVRAYPPITAVEGAADCALIPGVWTAN
jgi:hypothetical protein